MVDIGEKVFTISGGESETGGGMLGYYKYDKPITINSWNYTKTKIRSGKIISVRKGTNIIKWVAWHLPYKISWRWR